MVETSASPASIAARYSATEQAVQWLLDNRGSGGGDGETAELLKRLYRALVAGAVASGTWNPDKPWEDTLIYDGADKSLHLTLFGLDDDGAVRCQDGKGFHGRVFSPNEVRWAGTGSTYDKSLADDIFGRGSTGYLDRIRSQNLSSLAQAIFKTSANITSGKTIIDRIADVQTSSDTAVASLTTNLSSYKTSNNTAVSDLAGRVSALEQRMTRAGL